MAMAEAIKMQVNVPDGMYAAAMKHCDSGIQCSAALAAALRWLVDWSRALPLDMLRDISIDVRGWDTIHNEALVQEILSVGLRRMLAREPRIPEGVDDLLVSLRGCSIAEIDERIREAHRRGLKQGSNQQ